MLVDDPSFDGPGIDAGAMREAHAAAVAALQAGDRDRLVSALRAMAVPAEDDVGEFAGVLLSLDETASRERLLRIAAMNTRDREQWRVGQRVPEIGVLWPPTASLTAPTTADRAEPGAGAVAAVGVPRPALARRGPGAGPCRRSPA
jgi:hypothetical protein